VRVFTWRPLLSNNWGERGVLGVLGLEMLAEPAVGVLRSCDVESEGKRS